MSLQVWLPLNGTLKNQGLASVNLTSGTPTYTTGKIGQCLATGSLTFAIDNNVITNLSDSNIYSMCCWCKNLDTSASSRWVFQISSGTGTTRGLWESNNTTARYWAYSGTGVNINTSINTIDGNWHHICFTSSGSIVKLYVDGIYQAQITNGSTTAMTTNTCTLNASNYNLNDFRVYDHCLSPMEVKELAKGLVLHYPLNRQGWGQENQFKNSNFTNGTNSWYGVNSSSIRVETKDGRLCGTGTKGTTSYIIGQTSAAYTGGTTVNFTISAKVYVSEAGTMAINNWITTTQASGWQGMSGTRVWNTSSNLSVGWNYVSTTLKNATNQYTGNIVTAFNYSGTTFWITDVKFEFGDKATPWCPNSSDALATTMGLNGTTEYDCSGFCNNGTRTGTFTWTSDTPKYQVSTKFLQSRIQCNGDFLYGLSTATLSAWVKLTAYHSERCMVVYANGRYLTINNSGQLSGYSYGKTPAGYYNSNQTIPLNTWTHITIVWDDTTWYFYINGILVNSWACTGTFTNVGGYASVGQESNGGRSVSGLISDARIYATALSADDVKSLYQNSAYIDSSGNVYGAVHSEV